MNDCFKLNVAVRMRAVPQAAAAAVPGHAGTWNAGPQLVVGVSCCDRLFIPEETLTQEYGRQACLIGWLVLRRKNMFRILHELPFLELPNEQVCHCPTSEWLELHAGIFYFNLFFNSSRYKSTVLKHNCFILGECLEEYSLQCAIAIAVVGSTCFLLFHFSLT